MLVALYDATGGANWGINTNWNSSAPVREWWGVTTDGDGRVTARDLHGNNLSAPLPSAPPLPQLLTALLLLGGGAHYRARRQPA